ncbi:hypothetical protein [Slackia heliotrinireducens]|uniref:hypothetical protein n=1 Tax=Slackia heliotrinireducens TaxID=84110 RepID=UPI0033151EFD
MAEDFERLMRTNEQLAAERKAQDNGFADLAENDEAKLEERETLEETAELSFEEKLVVLNRAVTRQPLNRELMLRILSFCTEEKKLNDVENHVMSFPEYSRATENPVYMTKVLVRCDGLEEIERTAEGKRVLPEDKEGLTEDEIDDLVATTNFITTEVGAQVVADHSPAARLAALLETSPERAETFQEMLEFVAEKPRTYGEVTDLLKGRPVLQTIINGRTETVQPSVFIDKLERAGVLVWDNGWKLTKEGEAFLANK